MTSERDGGDDSWRAFVSLLMSPPPPPEVGYYSVQFLDIGPRRGQELPSVTIGDDEAVILSELWSFGFCLCSRRRCSGFSLSRRWRWYLIGPAGGGRSRILELRWRLKATRILTPSSVTWKEMIRCRWQSMSPPWTTCQWRDYAS